ncbi:hypothetical protein RB12851 [Rhodopirellula baltica SH 1]|uniref:Uncharacterized protein n=1 Tax=Rhodopirellula baltica (strain DSM 10527 / NCIMB 13988 / SH1) TaxID=243090 RepID=Q7TTC3_RHOBA|nr:hypothetical protein RB5371 [Rhodopirellula baltica SH 1]CAD76150.1 hypothetical protein RB9231 [Rhodopirellula baltica SH 1]CAD77164.1 hypothetical protein RB11109 [Rhodopirellula baltica SH 1]CAD77819.1 hypothetical protein RB12851 [Rhodopirellula baltica SH 1]
MTDSSVLFWAATSFDSLASFQGITISKALQLFDATCDRVLTAAKYFGDVADASERKLPGFDRCVASTILLAESPKKVSHLGFDRLVEVVFHCKCHDTLLQSQRSFQSIR